jgi:hypothetical protein
VVAMVIAGDRFHAGDLGRTTKALLSALWPSGQLVAGYRPAACTPAMGAWMIGRRTPSRSEINEGIDPGL